MALSSWRNIFNPAPMPGPDAYPNMLWSEQHERYALWMKYYTGEILDELADPNKSNSGKKYPLRINLAKQIATTNSYAVLGEWDENVFTWKGLGTEGGKEADLDFLSEVSRRSRLNSLYIRQVLTHSVLGGMVWGIQTSPAGLRWISVPPENFFPVFSAFDEELLECFISRPISSREAHLRWPNLFPGVGSLDETLMYVSHWTRESCETTVGNELVEVRPTIDGIIPYVYIPRIGVVGERYGESVIEDIRGLQDELNARMADLGDSVVRETHRPLMFSNLPNGLRGIKRTDEFIDLGMGLGNSSPTVHDYTLSSVPTVATEFMGDLVNFVRHAGNTPPVAFGEDEGSQRSGMTLVLRMWPLLQAARNSRGFIADGMTELADKTLRLGRVGGWADGRIKGGSLYAPDFAPMLPRDREQLVNEVVQLSSVELISPERALDLLNVPEDERAKELARLQAIQEEARAYKQEQMKTQLAAKEKSNNASDSKSEN